MSGSLGVEYNSTRNTKKKNINGIKFPDFLHDSWIHSQHHLTECVCLHNTHIYMHVGIYHLNAGTYINIGNCIHVFLGPFSSAA